MANPRNAVRPCVSSRLGALAAFPVEALGVPDEIDYRSCDDFVLRAGINMGPAVAGVTGACRLQYDILGKHSQRGQWMDGNGVPGRIQVTEEVHRLLRRGTYHFVCRGKVGVQGKGEVLTYFLEGRTDGSGSQTRGEAVLLLLGFCVCFLVSCALCLLITWPGYLCACLAPACHLNRYPLDLSREENATGINSRSPAL
ncbi:adenylate cyclase type 1-like [Vicugna pacos]